MKQNTAPTRKHTTVIIICMIIFCAPELQRAHTEVLTGKEASLEAPRPHHPVCARVGTTTRASVHVYGQMSLGQQRTGSEKHVG